MKLKLDENLPAAATELLVREGHDVTTVQYEALGGAPDEVVVGAAASEGRILFTLDRGMADPRAHPPGSHPGIVVFRLREQDVATTLDAIGRFVDTVDAAEIAACNVIVETDGYRVRRRSP